MVPQWEDTAVLSPSHQIMDFVHMSCLTHITVVLTNTYQVLIHLPFHLLRYLQWRKPVSHDQLPLTCRRSISIPIARLRCIMEAMLHPRSNHQVAWLQICLDSIYPHSRLYTISPQAPPAPHIEQYVIMFYCATQTI
jgi:hypothetical protein